MIQESTSLKYEPSPFAGEGHFLSGCEALQPGECNACSVCGAEVPSHPPPWLHHWEGYRESRRCSRDTYPESYITKYIRIRRFPQTVNLQPLKAKWCTQEYETAQCGPSEDRACASCAGIKACPASSFRVGCGGGSAGTCNACATPGAGEYQVNNFFEEM